MTSAVNGLPAKVLLNSFLVLAGLLTVATGAGARQPEQEPALAIEFGNPALQWGPCPAFFGDGCHIAVLHGDPAKPNTDVFFRMAGGNSFPPHRHTSAERMVMVAGEMDVTYENQDTERLTAGTYAFGPAHRVHHGRCVSEEDCVLFIAFEEPVDAFEVAEE